MVKLREATSLITEHTRQQAADQVQFKKRRIRRRRASIAAEKQITARMIEKPAWRMWAQMLRATGQELNSVPHNHHDWGQTTGQACFIPLLSSQNTLASTVYGKSLLNLHPTSCSDNSFGTALGPEMMR